MTLFTKSDLVNVTKLCIYEGIKSKVKLPGNKKILILDTILQFNFYFFYVSLYFTFHK